MVLDIKVSSCDGQLLRGQRIDTPMLIPTARGEVSDRWTGVRRRQLQINTSCVDSKDSPRGRAAEFVWEYQPAMNVRLLTKIDRWAGVPACFALTCCKHVFGWASPAKGALVESILFVKLAEQGSTVLAHRALQKAVERVGREHVFMVVFEDNRFIVDVLALIPAENVFTVSTAGILPLVRGAVSALIRLRRIRGLAAIDLEFFARASAAFAYLSGAVRAHRLPRLFRRGAVSRKPDVASHPL
jgi:hypothetical protein